MREITVLDGGMSRELMRLGAPFRQPEWSALALLETPDLVRAAHRAFAGAGAQVLTTNAYAVVPFHLGEGRFRRSGARLAELAATLARQVADDVGARVAGCLPPPLGSYRPDVADDVGSVRILEVLIEAQAPHVDMWLVETRSSIAEVELAASVVRRRSDVPLWISYTVNDVDGVTLRSGEPVEDAVRAAEQVGAAVVAFNCSRPAAIEAALHRSRPVTDLTMGAYANALVNVASGAANEAIAAVDPTSTPASFVAWAERCCDAGAVVIGGCCGIDARHIAALSAHLSAG
jgi:S-methylmethionine-dependent homocysteine/selenocysteine methylase